MIQVNSVYAMEKFTSAFHCVSSVRTSPSVVNRKPPVINSKGCCFLGKTARTSRFLKRKGEIGFQKRSSVVNTSAELQILTENMVTVESSVGTSRFMSVASWPPRGVDNVSEDSQETQGYALSDADKLARQEVVEGGVDIRVYQGRIIRGPSANAKVILKAFPSRSRMADRLATQELVAFASMQEDEEENGLSPYLVKLLGAFIPTEGLTSGEQWLVFRNDGTTTAADYAAQAAVASSKGEAVGEFDFWDQFDEGRSLNRRQLFIKVMLFQAMRGLLFVHQNNFVHQSLGPNSVLLSTVDERDVRTLQVRLQDLSFAVDIRPETLQKQQERGVDSQDLAADLWKRAEAAGASTIEERRSFALADDMYAAGLLLAYLTFCSLSEPGQVDGLSLLKLFEGTFRLDITATRDYCAADPKWYRTVDFLDENQKAGWDLLQMMLNPDWKQRPTTQEVLDHRFFRA